eukprot:5641939-Prymnesium_polylepis.1
MLISGCAWVVGVGSDFGDRRDRVGMLEEEEEEQDSCNATPHAKHCMQCGAWLRRLKGLYIRVSRAAHSQYTTIVYIRVSRAAHSQYGE